MSVTTVTMVILLLFGSAMSKALLKARFEKLEESYATKIFFKSIMVFRKDCLLLIHGIFYMNHEQTEHEVVIVNIGYFLATSRLARAFFIIFDIAFFY
jgi:hypothetical protein